MGILRRYVILETLKLFGLTIVGTLLLMTLGGGVREGIREGLPPQLVFRTMPYLIPEMLRFTIPGCLLFAVCSVFGRLTSSNELVALKSLGIHPLKIVWPVLGLSYLLSILTFEIYDVCAIWSRPGLRQLVAESLTDIAYSVLRVNGSFSRQGLSIVVKGVDGDRLVQPVITFEPGGDNPLITLTAEMARLSMDREQGVLHVEGRNGQLEVAGKASLSLPDFFEHSLVINPQDPDAVNSASPAAIGTRLLPSQIRRERGLIRELETRLATAQQEGAPDVAARQTQLGDHRARLFRLQAEIPRRLSNGFGCLCFALIGMPMAMWRRSSDTMSVFFACFAPILFVYYPLLVTGENLARGGTLPLVSVWLADAVLLVAGIVLLRRILRH
jgi:lipopolysaccharide export system permease protein